MTLITTNLAHVKCEHQINHYSTFEGSQCQLEFTQTQQHIICIVYLIRLVQLCQQKCI